jgi:hypothetical protein
MVCCFVMLLHAGQLSGFKEHTSLPAQRAELGCDPYGNTAMHAAAPALKLVKKPHW